MSNDKKKNMIKYQYFYSHRCSLAAEDLNRRWDNPFYYQ
jgi:hypothetical protein